MCFPPPANACSTHTTQGGTPLEVLNTSAETPLVLAVNLGNINAMEALVVAGASRHQRIHWAAEHGHETVRGP